jgi:hypothetical protein
MTAETVSPDLKSRRTDEGTQVEREESDAAPADVRAAESRLLEKMIYKRNYTTGSRGPHPLRMTIAAATVYFN